MMNIKQKQVNVSRLQLLETLKKNRETHKQEYLEALELAKANLISSLKAALKQVNSKTAADLRKFELDYSHPQCHLREFDEAIEMLEWSTDDVLNIDAETFRAYVLNEWYWKSAWENQINTYKVGSFLK